MGQAVRVGMTASLCPRGTAAELGAGMPTFCMLASFRTVSLCPQQPALAVAVSATLQHRRHIDMRLRCCSQPSA